MAERERIGTGQAAKRHAKDCAAVAIAFFAIIILIGSAHAGFSLTDLVVAATLNQDGSAHVEERIDFVVGTASSRQLYESSLEYKNDLATWKERLELNDVRHHVSLAEVSINDIRVQPQPVKNCNSYIESCEASLVFDYTVLAPSMNRSGLLTLDRYKPRTTRYALNSNALSFDVTKTGEILLPKGTKLVVEVPRDAQRIYFSKPPDNLEENAKFATDPSGKIKYYVGSLRSFEWSGQTLPRFEISYEIEESLESEMVGFIAGMQTYILGVVAGTQGLAVIGLALVVVVSAVYLTSIRKKRA
jgi:hypothetical protein